VVAESLNKPTRTSEKYDVVWQYGFVAPPGAAADVSLTNDGII